MKTLKGFFIGLLVGIIMMSGIVYAATEGLLVEVFYTVNDIVIDGISQMPETDKPFILNSRTYVPLGFVSENLGYTVSWDGIKKTVILDKEVSMSEDEMNIINVSSYQFGFEPSVINVMKGQKTKLIITTEDVAHGFKVNGLDIDVEIKPNEEAIVEFTPDTVGTFKISCNVFCGTGHSDMSGTIVVSE